jgi:hypothetical protein
MFLRLIILIFLILTYHEIQHINEKVDKVYARDISDERK